MSLRSALLAGPARPALIGATAAIAFGVVALAACRSPKDDAKDPQAALVAKGREIFFNETFNGNGRTCGTCHREEENFTLTPAFIATLPPDDPLFVAETNPALAKNFENPRLMREFGLILENLDGFDDLENKFVMRGIPHTLALPTSVASPQGPRTGWSGDGAPGDGSLRSFATGAVIQHFTRTLNRVPGVDFRLPTDDELDALEAFQLSLGRRQDLVLPLPLKGTVARRGQDIFLDNNLGKCNICHSNAGANAVIAGANAGNANFDTGVENLPDQPARLTGEKVPADDGFGRPGDGTFNTPPLVEAADSGPFFHNNAIETIEGAVAFYNGAAFNNSPSGRFLASTDPNGVGIRLDATQVVEVAAFLRVLNAIENIRQSLAHLANGGRDEIRRAGFETDDAIRVLGAGGLHPEAVERLEEARRRIDKAAHAILFKHRNRRAAIEALEQARDAMVDKT
jgi:mono/diheme cytochrome c family protein